MAVQLEANIKPWVSLRNLEFLKVAFTNFTNPG